MEQCSQNLSFLFGTMRMEGPSPQGFGGRVDGRVSYPARHQHTVGFSRQSLLLNKSTGTCPPCWCVFVCVWGGATGAEQAAGPEKREGETEGPCSKTAGWSAVSGQAVGTGKGEPCFCLPNPALP